MATEATHITFAEDAIHRVGSNGRPSSYKAASIKEKEAGLDVEDGVREGELKQKQEFRGVILLWLAYQSIGVIYGDIGTSPLYVYSSTFSSEPSYLDLLGALSLIIWTLTLMVTIKYVVIVLQADDEGEGGTFALYALLARFANITQRDPKEQGLIKIERHRTNEMKLGNRSFRAAIENSKVAKLALKVVGVFGVSLVMADGVLTPAQSVLGAIQGLEVVHPNITSSQIIGTSCGILVVLFIIQPLGTSKIATAFAPIVIIWLLFNLVFGIYNLALHDHSVLKAFSPFFAGDYLARNKTEGWKSLGGILLCFTGVEALFADLGAFSKKAIQLSWLCFAYPCLLMAYIGQAAYISVDPSAYSNPFFKCAPPGTIYPSLVISVLAAFVASQAMVTSSFQLLSQVMKLSYFPHIKLVHTSSKFYGQVYIPLANWLLMIGTVIVTAVYSNTTRLGNAYGVCVILVTFITTCMVSTVALVVWRLHFLIVLAGFLVFGALDGAYLSAAMTKVPTGAWFTLALAVILSSIFILWRYGKERQWGAEREGRLSPTEHFVVSPADSSLYLSSAFGGARLTQTKGMGIFFDKSGSGSVPTVFSQFTRKFEAYPEIMVFFHMRPLQIPAAAPEDRYTILRTSIPNAYRIIIRHGYTEEVITPNLALLLYSRLEAFIQAQPYSLPTAAPAFSSPPDNNTPTLDSKLHHNPSATVTTSPPSLTTSSLTSTRPDELDVLRRAFEAQVVYIVGKEQMRISDRTNLAKRIVLATFLWIRENTRGKVAEMRIPVDRLVEVGFIKEL